MRFMAVAAIALTLASVSAAISASGLRGIVTRGPITPVCVANVPCSAPATHVRLTFRHGSIARSVVTDNQGRYRVLLVPGTYAVTIGGVSAQFGYRPRVVEVPSGRVVARNFSIDTGIR